jgi:DNA-binding XRE family transcriptional regulator
MAQRRSVNKVRSRYQNRVQACRLRAGIAKQEALARRTGIPRTTLSALERNRLFLSSTYALLIQEELGCTLDDLYQRVGPAGEADAGQKR